MKNLLQNLQLVSGESIEWICNVFWLPALFFKFISLTFAERGHVVQFNSVIFDSSPNKPATVNSDCDSKVDDTKRNNYNDIEISDLIWLFLVSWHRTHSTEEGRIQQKIGNCFFYCK